MDQLFFDSLAQAGTKVRLRADPSQVGECTGKVRDEGDCRFVQVRFVGQKPQLELASDLEPAEAALDEETVVREGRFARAMSLRKRLTAVQLQGRINELIYSLDTTNTEFMPHQFKPLLTLLDSPSKGLLIADEVGLGKTIEAGLIWTELRFRTQATRLLVVCPAMLTTKWKDELSSRFGTMARIMGPAEVLEALDADTSLPQGMAIICSLQGIRPPSGWKDPNDPSTSPVARLARRLEEAAGTYLFDLTVIDEAHYLRNSETSSAELGRLLRPVSEHLLLLSATPVNLRSSDLFNLVSLVDPEQFLYPHQFEQVLRANRPLVQAANQLKRREATAATVAECLDAAANHWLFDKSASLRQLREDLAAMSQAVELPTDVRVELIQRLERVNLLGQVVVRTRKREVFENRVERKARRIPASMSEPEQQLYWLVSQAVAEYAAQYEGVEGFLLCMPQQQMASCMYAAARRWSAIGGEGAEELAEMASEALDIIEDFEAGPIVSHVSRHLAGRIDLRALREQDTKFGVLLELLRLHQREHPDEKVLLFSYFRPTLGYLRERLEAEGIPALVVQGGDDKQARIKEFEKSSRYRVLLSSEVASEGVDLQFMRVIINYDLPWNPMKIEQRIGRIDRIGQKADSISIFNLTYAETIDDKILVRLFDRLGLFEGSLGCTEEVLGDSIGQLTKELLSARLTPEQEIARIEGTLAAIEQRKKDMALVEESEADLVGLGDYVRSRVSQARKTHRRVTDQDLLSHIRDYLDSFPSGHVLQMDPAQPTHGTVRLPPEVVARLERFREHHRLPMSKLESGHETRVVIRNHVSPGGVTGKFELVNQYHPLIRMIASDQGHVAQGDFLHAVEIAAGSVGTEISSGVFAFSAEAWQFAGARDEETLRAVFVPIHGEEIVTGDRAFDLLNALRSDGRDWLSPGAELPEASQAIELLDGARAALVHRFKATSATLKSENDDRVRIQRETVLRNAERRRASLQQRLYKAEDVGQKTVVQLTQGQLRKLEEQTAVGLARVEGRGSLRTKRTVLAEGFVRVVP